eukprot:Gb_39996 [translate_table: standard]
MGIAINTVSIGLILLLACAIQAAAANDSSGICNIVTCGKGTCNQTSSGQFLENLIPKCECDQGWRQPSIGIPLSFLPCVLPNCSLDSSCSGTVPFSAPPSSPAPSNASGILDPCHYAVCGEGSCVKTSDYGYKCDCNEGYENLLNMTSAPCLRECSIGADCKQLGVSVGGNGSTSPPAQPDTSTSQGVVDLRKPISHLIVMAMSTIFVCWR